MSGHFRERPGYRVYRELGSGNWLLTLTLSGHGLYRHAGEKLLASAGDMVLLKPGVLHDYSVPRGDTWEFLWVHFHPRLEWFSWLNLPEDTSGLCRVSIRSAQSMQRAERAFERLQVDTRAYGGIQRELALNALEEVLLLAVHESELLTGRETDPRIQQVLSVISSNLSAELDITALARDVGLSPSRLAHLFKEEVGDSPARTILSLRMRQAARLLEHTVEPVNVISEQVGFNSPYYFSRQFHRLFGVSPRDYRKAVRLEREESLL